MYHLLLLLAFQSDVVSLGSNDFATRERAEARLTRWADLCYPLLDRPFPDLEQRRRAGRIVSQVIPQQHPPIALLCDDALPEWELRDETGIATCIGKYPSTKPGWKLTYIRPHIAHATFARTLPQGLVSDWVVTHYGERARTQHLWLDWQSDSDSREATRLLCQDMRKWGVPPYLVRAFLSRLQGRERALFNPAPACP